MHTLGNLLGFRPDRFVRSTHVDEVVMQSIHPGMQVVAASIERSEARSRFSKLAFEAGCPFFVLGNGLLQALQVLLALDDSGVACFAPRDAYPLAPEPDTVAGDDRLPWLKGAPPRDRICQ